jgi:hypothetical protein
MQRFARVSSVLWGFSSFAMRTAISCEASSSRYTPAEMFQYCLISCASEDHVLQKDNFSIFFLQVQGYFESNGAEVKWDPQHHNLEFLSIWRNEEDVCEPILYVGFTKFSILLQPLWTGTTLRGPPAVSHVQSFGVNKIHRKHNNSLPVIMKEDHTQNRQRIISESSCSLPYIPKMEFENDGQVAQWLKKFLEAHGAALDKQLDWYSCS